MLAELTTAHVWKLIREVLVGERTLERKGGTHVLKLPNLRVRDVNVYPAQQAGGEWDVEISAVVENAGIGHAAECDVVATATVFEPPFSPNSVQSFSFQARCPSLGPNSYTFSPIQIGVISDLTSRSIVSVRVCVDPPTTGRPGGMIWESNEEDNCKDGGVFLQFVENEDIDIPPAPGVERERPPLAIMDPNNWTVR